MDKFLNTHKTVRYRGCCELNGIKQSESCTNSEREALEKTASCSLLVLDWTNHRRQAVRREECIPGGKQHRCQACGLLGKQRFQLPSLLSPRLIFISVIYNEDLVCLLVSLLFMTGSHYVVLPSLELTM